MIKTSIIWFKTDLRLSDNEIVSRAVTESDLVIPIFCFDEDHFKTSEFGFKKMGNFRANFLLESLDDLNTELIKCGSELLILKGRPEVELTKIAREYNVQTIYTQEEVGIEELRTQKLVEKEVANFGCVLNVIHTHNLYQPDQLPFEIVNIPNVFTEFRKKVEEKVMVNQLFIQPETIKSPKTKTFEMPTLTLLGLNMVNKDLRSVINFNGGSTAAKQRLEEYFFQNGHLSNYKETRNGMIGANYSTKFSAWLALGCISPKEIYYQIKNYEEQFGANESTYWLIFELLWRDYFWLMMMKYGSKFFQLNGIRKKMISIPTNQHHPEIEKWVKGETGNNFIDSNMLELKLTGFLSNRGRQNVASFFCNEMQMDWRYGAAYFEQQLIDYDVASTWCNWAYIAGVGNDPRGKRYFNIEKQAEIYDPHQEYQRLWLVKND